MSDDDDETIAENDDELKAMNACVRALRVLDDESLNRVLRYLRQRFETEDE